MGSLNVSSTSWRELSIGNPDSTRDLRLAELTYWRDAVKADELEDSPALWVLRHELRKRNVHRALKFE